MAEIKTVGELRAALDGLPDGAEWIVCVDAPVDPDRNPDDPQPGLFVDPGAVREIQVFRPGDQGWPFAEGDPAPPALVYLMIGDWG